ncbi:hypothetical protein RUM44_004610 [Polyplax serrata]|uniref:Uncharacterized protein n=1 Tax=Polyplax serrata TaxID=468196 RepID=A0ABR1B3S0_POLSC
MRKFNHPNAASSITGLRALARATVPANLNKTELDCRCREVENRKQHLYCKFIGSDKKRNATVSSKQFRVIRCGNVATLARNVESCGKTKHARRKPLKVACKTGAKCTAKLEKAYKQQPPKVYKSACEFHLPLSSKLLKPDALTSVKPM